jgi:hypothetical protein
MPEGMMMLEYSEKTDCIAAENLGGTSAIQSTSRRLNLGEAYPGPVMVWLENLHGFRTLGKFENEKTRLIAGFLLQENRPKMALPLIGCSPRLQGEIKV